MVKFDFRGCVEMEVGGAAEDEESMSTKKRVSRLHFKEAESSSCIWVVSSIEERSERLGRHSLQSK